MKIIKLLNQSNIKKWKPILSKYANLLEKKGKELAKCASKVDNSSMEDNLSDIRYVVRFLKKINLQLELGDKYYFIPYGTVLIGLPYNEPIVTTIIPVISALVMGNKVIVKPARSNIKITRKLLNPLYKLGVSKKKLIIQYIKRNKIKNLINQADLVFWMGSYNSSRKIASICIKLDKKFYIETEAINYCIIDNSLNNKQLYKVSSLLIKSILVHNGQRCQTVRGVLVSKEVYNKFVEIFNDCLRKYEDKIKVNYRPTLKEKLSYEFGPILWIDKYENTEELVNFLNKNQFSLSLYIFSRKKIEKLFHGFLKRLSYSRVVINKDPSIVKLNEPWGGIKKSGMFGPVAWLNKFSNRMYIVV
jgi:acyl-CoA reductase-like NAD-dependent aldehyde dehydrogenase